MKHCLPGRVQLLAPAFALLALGCAHSPQRPEWHCISRIESNGIIAATFRSLDAQGRQLSVRSEWLRPYALQPRSLVRGVWLGRNSGPDITQGRVTMELALQKPERVRLQLRAASANGPDEERTLVGDFTSRSPSLTLRWPVLQQLLAPGRPLSLLATRADDTVAESERIDPSLFTAALAAMRETIERSRELAADYQQLCEPHQEIILTGAKPATASPAPGLPIAA